MKSVFEIKKQADAMKPSNKIEDEKVHSYFEGYYNALRWVLDI